MAVSEKIQIYSIIHLYKPVTALLDVPNEFGKLPKIRRFDDVRVINGAFLLLFCSEGILYLFMVY